MQNYEAYDDRFDMSSRMAVSERADFLAKTYIHLMGAVLAFVAIVAGLLQTNLAEQIVVKVMGSGQLGWLIVLGVFMLVSYVANMWAQSDSSRSVQYFGLGLYVLAEAFIFTPLLYIAHRFGGDGVIQTAGIITLLAFGGLTAIVLLTRKNFSFMGPILGVAGFAALGYILCGAIFGFSIGITFTVLMVVFACGSILYDTSNILHSYPSDKYVAASLALFASVALLFWYVLQLVLRMSSRD